MGRGGEARAGGGGGAGVPIVELVLRNGRVLRVAETMVPELLGRMAAALDGEC